MPAGACVCPYALVAVRANDFGRRPNSPVLPARREQIANPSGAAPLGNLSVRNARSYFASHARRRGASTELTGAQPRRAQAVPVGGGARSVLLADEACGQARPSVPALGRAGGGPTGHRAAKRGQVGVVDVPRRQALSAAGACAGWPDVAPPLRRGGPSGRLCSGCGAPHRDRGNAGCESASCAAPAGSSRGSWAAPEGLGRAGAWPGRDVSAVTERARGAGRIRGLGRTRTDACRRASSE